MSDNLNPQGRHRYCLEILEYILEPECMTIGQAITGDDCVQHQLSRHCRSGELLSRLVPLRSSSLRTLPRLAWETGPALVLPRRMPNQSLMTLARSTQRNATTLCMSVNSWPSYILSTIGALFFMVFQCMLSPIILPSNGSQFNATCAQTSHLK